MLQDEVEKNSFEIPQPEATWGVRNSSSDLGWLLSADFIFFFPELVSQSSHLPKQILIYQYEYRKTAVLFFSA
jgi:hypothetical protein